MLAYQIHIGAEQALKVIGSSTEFVGVRRHDHKDIHITVFRMLPTGYGSKHPHVADAKVFSQLFCMSS